MERAPAWIRARNWSSETSARAHLAISNGGTVVGNTVPQPDLGSLGAVYIAHEAGSTGRVTVDGAGFELHFDR